MNKTSLTHPLQIAAVSAGAGLGSVGLTFCPGKRDRHAMTGVWDRDLGIDLDAIRAWGAAAVITLITQEEFDLLGVQALGKEVVLRQMLWFHLPIVDASTPDSKFERQWDAAAGKLHALIRNRQNVLVHCRGGLGRAGTIAARLLIELGWSPEDAILQVRAVRSGAIENKRQENYIKNIKEKATPRRPTDWFEKLTGFRELDYATTRAKLEVAGTQLRSLVNGAIYEIGKFELSSLQALREKVQATASPEGRLKVRIATGDVRAMHREPDNAGALFQVASQFNMLEMVGPSVTPEQGVTRYQNDHTQGPACAIAAGAATIYRNYFVSVGNAFGQTAKRQLDGLADIGANLSDALNVPIDQLWTMQNGYALAQRSGLELIARHLDTLDAQQTDALRAKLCIGIHRNVEATEADGGHRPLVSQAFCSALPVAYSKIASSQWQSFAVLILEAAYEATMWAAVLNERRGGSNVVFLTLLGGGAFGNDDQWIHGAIRRALQKAAGFALDVRLVCYSSPPTYVRELVQEFR